MTISKYNPAYIKFTMQENNLRELQEQLAAGPVQVTTVPRSAKGKPRTGTITFYDNTVDQASGTIAVKATFENANGALWPGRSANVMVHFADNEYDHGPIIIQRAVPVLDDDTPDSVAARVFELEREAYPEAIRLFAEGKLKIEGRRVRILDS